MYNVASYPDVCYSLDGWIFKIAELHVNIIRECVLVFVCVYHF